MLIIIKRASASYFYISISYLYGDIAVLLIIAFPPVGVICRSYLPCCGIKLQKGFKHVHIKHLIDVLQYVSLKKSFWV